MNKLSLEERTKVIAQLVEGTSIRATVRITGIAKKTVMRLLVEAGEACERYCDVNIRNLKCNRLECDEIWAFCGAKAKNVSEQKKREGWGDCWTWVCIDPETKLIPAWHVGSRDANDAYWFIQSVAGRLASRVQMTTDGLKCYIQAVEDAFGADIDYAQLIKLYGSPLSGKMGEDHPTEVRYSPPECIGTKKKHIQGNPDPEFISTSIVERQNLTMRMQMRRFTRLTNAFSKKLRNHKAAIALHFLHYNFARIHQTLRCTPAMEAGLAKHVWSIEEIAKLK